MGVKLCQAANSIVTPLDDAKFYSWITKRTTGIVEGCVVTSAGTNQLSISAGWGVIQGHIFVVQAETISATVAPSGTLNGRLLIRIDTADTESAAEFITQAATPLPALTQENIDGSGAIYEFSLATYDVGTISISALVNSSIMAKTPEIKYIKTTVSKSAPSAGQFSISGAASTFVPAGSTVVDISAQVAAGYDTAKINAIFIYNNTPVAVFNNAATLNFVITVLYF